MTHLGQTLPQGIGKFSVEMAGNNVIKNETEDADSQVWSPLQNFIFWQYLTSKFF